MKKYISVIVCLVILVTFFCSCGKNGDNEETKYVISYSTTLAEPSATQNYENPVQSAIESSVFDNGNDVTNNGNQSQETTLESNTSADIHTENVPQSTQNITTTQMPVTTEAEKKGELQFSDSADNKYIQAVVKKYGVNAEYLAAIYEEPAGEGNTVLEFDGSRDENGKLIRTGKTLISIYSIDKNMNITLASRDENKTEHSKSETLVIFYMTAKYILPEYEDELMG